MAGAELKPLVPGQSPRLNNRAGPAQVRALSSGRGYLSVAVLDQLKDVSAARQHASPTTEAVQLFPDVPSGKVYAVPCSRDDPHAYVLTHSRESREAWISMQELYEEFNMVAPTRMMYTITTVVETHETLGPCVTLLVGDATLRSRSSGRSPAAKAAAETAAAGSEG